LKVIQEKTSLDVVIDQIGTPTSSIFLADTTYYIIRSIIKNKNFNNFGTYNITSDGYTSWHGYACFILDQAIHLKYKTTLISKNIKGISTYKIPKEAKRPMNSRLDNTKFKNTFMLNIPHWEDEVKKSLKELIQIKS
jgi:dTDP-4-dehydrorhamnose reductase